MISVHSKKTFVKPLCENDYSSIQRKVTPTIHPFNKENSDPNVIKTMNENKHNQILKMDAAYSGLLSSIEELQKWKAIVEMENRQKNKKIESLLETVEIQKKTNLDLQIQTENLNLQFAEEIQQRNLVTEKLYSTIEMCSALKKHISTLQGHFECREQIEDLVNTADKKRLREIDNLRSKLDKLHIEHSEKVEYLTNALGLETNKILDLRDKYEQQLSEVENEKDALCTMIKNYEREITNLSAVLEEEKAKTRIYERERNDRESTIFQLENAKETYALLLKEKEDALNKVEISKQDLEKQIIFQSSQASDHQVKYRELLDASEVWKVESEKKILDFKKLLEQLSDKTSDLEKRLEQEQTKYQETLCSLQDVKKEKSLLEIQIEESLSKVEGIKDLKKNFKLLEEANAMLLKEKKDLSISLEDINKDLINCKAENEQLSLKCAEESKLLSNLKEEYEKQLNNEAGKIFSKQNDYDLLLTSFKAMEKDLEEKSQIIINKEESIAKLQSDNNDKENTIQVLQKENIEIKKDFELEKEKDKTCTKCEEFSIKLAEVEALKVELEKVKEEVANKDRSVMDVLLLLQDTEATFNKHRLGYAKEIEDLKKQVRSLTHENICLKFDNEEIDKLKLQNKDFNDKVEKLNVEILEHIEREKHFENKLQEKNVNQQTDIEAKKADLCELKEVTDNQSSDVSDSVQNEKPVANKMSSNDKRWDMDSSSSDCLEMVYDKENENQVRLVKKSRFDSKQNEVASSSNKETKQWSFQTKRKRDIQKVSQEDVVRARLGLPPRKKDGFKSPSSKEIPQFNMPKRNEDFFLTENKIITKQTPATPQSEKMAFNKKRVFFKKSLEERKSNFKKLESPRPWF